MFDGVFNYIRNINNGKNPIQCGAVNYSIKSGNLDATPKLFEHGNNSDWHLLQEEDNYISFDFIDKQISLTGYAWESRQKIAIGNILFLSHGKVVMTTILGKQLIQKIITLIWEEKKETIIGKLTIVLINFIDIFDLELETFKELVDFFVLNLNSLVISKIFKIY